MNCPPLDRFDFFRKLVFIACISKRICCFYFSNLLLVKVFSLQDHFLLKNQKKYIFLFESFINKVDLIDFPCFDNLAVTTESSIESHHRLIQGYWDTSSSCQVSKCDGAVLEILQEYLNYESLAYEVVT